jgi:hypothetical protein
MIGKVRACVNLSQKCEFEIRVKIREYIFFPNLITTSSSLLMNPIYIAKFIPRLLQVAPFDKKAKKVHHKLLPFTLSTKNFENMIQLLKEASERYYKTVSGLGAWKTGGQTILLSLGTSLWAQVFTRVTPFQEKNYHIFIPFEFPIGTLFSYFKGWQPRRVDIPFPPCPRALIETSTHEQIRESRKDIPSTRLRKN